MFPDRNPSSRLFYITSQAVDYVKSCLHLESGRLHADDMTSVLEAIRRDSDIEWIEGESGESGESHWRNFFAFSPAVDSTGTGFQLGLQTAEQAAWLKKYGKNGVCLDGTHHSTRYSFKMITILVLDERQKGRPAAFFFCKEESEADLTVFFRGINERSDYPLKPAIVMTDDAVQYWKAWVNVFGAEGTQKLLCTWHLLKKPGC